MLLSTYTLWRRDIVRFGRQRSRLAGALGTPVVFWLVLGSGLGRSFIGDEGALAGGYLEYFFPGALAMIILFTAIFSTISIIEDRHAGFLQGVLASPAPRAAIVLAKVLAGSTLAVLQAGVFLLLAPLARISVAPSMLPPVAGVVGLLAFALTGLGFLLAWRLDSIQGFHAVMNLLLVPMWLLSGAIFPASGAAGWVQAVMAANPLTYGVTALRVALGSSSPDDGAWVLPVAVVTAFGFVVLVAAIREVSRAASQ